MADDVVGAVRRTPRPADDHQTPETVAQPGRGTTNAPTPVSQDAPNGTGELSPSTPEFRRGMMTGLERAAIALSEAGWTDLSMWLQNCEIRTHTPGYPAPWDAPPAPDVVDELFGQGLDVHTTDDDLEAYAALPECQACDGSGKDDHATVFEAPLAVHFAGPPVEIAGTLRQLCMWCGHVLLDMRLWTRSVPPEPWPDGALIKIEDGMHEFLSYTTGQELPPGCCALPDDEEPAGDPQCSKCPAPAVLEDHAFDEALCDVHLNDAYNAEAEADGRAEQELTDDDHHQDLDDEPWPSEEDQ